MSQPFADALSWVPKSRHLAATLTRAQDFARGLAHRAVTLEHLLLSLIEDPDASIVLQACQIDLQRLKADADAHLGSLPRVQHAAPEADPDLLRILDYAVAAAQQSRRREVNGAIVLAAVVGEGKSQAAAILHRNGLTFAEAIRALQTTSTAQKPPGPSPSSVATQATEQILANTRRKIDASRGGQAGSQRTQPPSIASPTPEPGDAASALPARSEVAAGTSAQTNWAPLPQTPAQLSGQRQGGRLPPPVPAAGNPAMTGRSGNGEWGADPASMRDLEGDIAEAIRSAGAPWPRPAMATQPVSHDAPPDARYGANAAGPPFPDPDQLAPQSAERSSSHRTSVTAAPPLRSAVFDAGRLVENIPRTMRVGRPVTVEVRIARAQVAALAAGLEGPGAVYQHSIVVTKAMALRLRAPGGGFLIESVSPETQWIESTLGFLTDDYASWRWTVTPQRRGRGRLQLVVSARTVGSDGVTAETALPDQTIEVQVRTNYARTVGRWSGWIAAAVAGGVLAKLGEGTWQTGIAALHKLID